MTNLLTDAQCDEEWMRQALQLAQQAGALGEVPVGAIVVHNGRIVGRGYNRKEIDGQATSHAEILAIQEASKELGRWRLWGCTLYVNLEPCLMCAGALYSSRIDRLVYGALDPKAGAVVSLYQILSDSRLNHRPLCTSGVLGEESAKMLKAFFQNLRKIDLVPKEIGAGQD